MTASIAKTVESAINAQADRSLPACCRLVREMGFSVLGLDSGNALEFDDGSVLATHWSGEFAGLWVAEG